MQDCVEKKMSKIIGYVRKNSALDDFVSFMDLSYGYSVRLVQDQ